MDIAINQDLRDSILGAVPQQYSNLEKAVFIYYQLCLKTEYALDYYLDEDRVKDNYRDPANLRKVDGNKNKNVVCFTFNAIYLKLLLEAGIIDEQQLFYNDVGIKSKLTSLHQQVEIAIDGHKYDCDATYGILDNNDLALLKYSCNKIQGIECYDDEVGQQLLDAAIQKVQADSLDLNALSKSYVELKQKEGSLKSLSLSERVEMFLSLVKESGLDYSLKSFTHLIKLKQILFTEQELGKTGIVLNIHFVFAKDVECDGELKAFFFFNDAGYVNDLGYENFANLRVFEISLKSNQIEEVSVNSIRERCVQKILLTRDNQDGVYEQIAMLKKGRLRLRTVFNSEPMYDEKQRPVDVAYYVRTHILTGKEEILTEEQLDLIKE